MIRHVVLLRIRPDATAEQIKSMFAALAGLKGKIGGVKSFSWGPYSSHEGLNQGFTHGFVMDFVDAAARDAYLPHPAHEAVKGQVVALLDGGLDDVVAFDYEL